MSDSLGVSHTPHAWILSITDFPQPYYRSMDLKIEPYSNAWASQVQKMKLHERAPHDEIESSSNPMDSLQGFLLPEVWVMPTWASAEALVLVPHLAILSAQLHVQNPMNLSLNLSV
jgi:hypothetical protein